LIEDDFQKSYGKLIQELKYKYVAAKRLGESKNKNKKLKIKIRPILPFMVKGRSGKKA